jgi:uncharacterized membrane protein (DUF4010 family)
MDQYETFIALGVALLLGLLIGFEREQSAPGDDRERRTFIGGARTYPLVSLTGALSTLLVPQLGAGVVLSAFAVVFAFLAIAYYDDVKRDGDRGMTSEAAFLVTFMLGALATSSGAIEPLNRRMIVLSAVAVVVALLLSAKPRMHALAEKASKDDVLATLKFLIVAVVVLPLLPNATFGPLDVLNPFKIGLMVVLIAGIDFIGYVAVRVLGPGRGLGLTGVVGGLASSTAVTLSVSARAREEPALAPSCALAVITASTIMVPRVLLEVAIVHRPLVNDLIKPLAAMTLGGAVAAYLLYRRSRASTGRSAALKLQNPFELSSALKWGLVFVVVLFVAKLAQRLFGESGVYLAGLLAGASDVDAITLSMASLSKSGTIESKVAVTTIMIGAASNTIVKGVMATVIGGRRYGLMVLSAFAGMLFCGALGVVALWL